MRDIHSSGEAASLMLDDLDRDNDELDLLARCRAGDDSAWNELVGRYERLVYSIALREGLPPEDAHDVTQLVFEALLRGLSAVRSSESLAGWLAAVTRRQVWRVRDRIMREQPVDLPDTWTGNGGYGTDEITEIDRAVTLYRGLQQLGEPCRSLLLALYFEAEQPSYQQVAARLGRPVGSIGPTRARCLERLRVAMGGDWA